MVLLSLFSKNQLFGQTNSLLDAKFSIGAGYTGIFHRRSTISPRAGIALNNGVSISLSGYPNKHQFKASLIGIVSRELKSFEYDTFGKVNQLLNYAAWYVNCGINLNPSNAENTAIFLEILLGKEKGTYRFMDQNNQKTEFLQATNPEKNILFGIGLFWEIPVYKNHNISVASNFSISEIFSNNEKKSTQPSPFKLNLQYEFVF